MVDKSVFAGVPRDSLSYEQIIELSEGKTLKSISRSRFYRSFVNLNIKIKEVSISITKTNDKKLIDNKYMPININLKSKENIIRKISKILNIIEYRYPPLKESGQFYFIHFFIFIIL